MLLQLQEKADVDAQECDVNSLSEAVLDALNSPSRAPVAEEVISAIFGETFSFSGSESGAHCSPPRLPPVPVKPKRTPPGATSHSPGERAQPRSVATRPRVFMSPNRYAALQAEEHEDGDRMTLMDVLDLVAACPVYEDAASTVIPSSISTVQAAWVAAPALPASKQGKDGPLQSTGGGGSQSFSACPLPLQAPSFCASPVVADAANLAGGCAIGSTSGCFPSAAMSSSSTADCSHKDGGMQSLSQSPLRAPASPATLHQQLGASFSLQPPTTAQMDDSMDDSGDSLDDSIRYDFEALHATPIGQARHAFLLRSGPGGVKERLAFGEVSAEDGIFTAKLVNDSYGELDIAGTKLGRMAGGLLSLDDVIAEEELDFEWIGAQDEPVFQECSVADIQLDRASSHDVYHQNDVQCQTESYLLNNKHLPGSYDVRVRVDTCPEDKRSSNDTRETMLVRFPEYLERVKRSGHNPILVSMESVRREQNIKSTYKMRAQESAMHVMMIREAHQRELEAMSRKIEELCCEHEEKLEIVRLQERARAKKEVDSMREWRRIELRQVAAHAQSEQLTLTEKHKQELAARSKLAETWRCKRQNKQRALLRACERSNRAAAKAAIAASDVAALQRDNDELHAVFGSSVQVAEQRQGEGKRAAFTPRTRLRDLQVRQHSLSTGASHARDITAVFSDSIAADGRNLKLESGSLSTVLRWEKTAEALCIKLEAQELRSALLAEPYTQVWFYMDLSPDSRAIEQYGGGFEYAGSAYQMIDESGPLTDSFHRISGESLSECEGAYLGVDGCPIVIEWSRRVFTPMLNAAGPKYAATCDSFIRTLQVYGLTLKELLAASFKFADVEHNEIPLPLIDRVEGFVSDAGGEVQKSGGVIHTVAPNSDWKHCGQHCANLALEKSKGYEHVGAGVRSCSSFCRGGNKHAMLVLHMERIQDPSCIPGDCDARLKRKYLDSHELVKKCGQFHKGLSKYVADPRRICTQVEQLACMAVAKEKIRRKSKKGTDVRWKYECEVLDDRLIDVAHLLAPAILIEYGDGETYAKLKIDEGTEKTPKNKSAAAALALLVDPKFIFWAMHLRFLFTLVYKRAFSEIGAHHHHSAPQLSGAKGLPVKWAAALRACVIQPQRANGKLRLNPSLCAPLVSFLRAHPCLGGETGDTALECASDLLQQAVWIEHYFGRWGKLQCLPHAVTLENISFGPLQKHVLDKFPYVSVRDILPRVPAQEALEAARDGLAQFEALSLTERLELKGSLPWRLFSPTMRNGRTNLIFEQTRAFAAGSLNPLTGQPYPFRCWNGLNKVLIAGGAKYCPSDSAQCESLFTALPRQQGASKLHISQGQISFEARCIKNDTMSTLTERTLALNWNDAMCLQRMLISKGFWQNDLNLAANRREQRKLGADTDISMEETQDASEKEYDVQRIEQHKRDRKTGLTQYLVKWEGYDDTETTWEPEENVLCTQAIVKYWRAKKNLTEIKRIEKLQEASLRERQEQEARRAKPLSFECDEDHAAGDPAAAAAMNASASNRPAVASASKHAYDVAHAALSQAASCLVFSIETSSSGGCVLQLGWVLADAVGAQLAAYDKLWNLPPRESIDQRSQAKHNITACRLAAEGVSAAEPEELLEFQALVLASKEKNVQIIAHHTSFSVSRLNHTAHCHRCAHFHLSSAWMLCTMHTATKHCRLRCRGGKGLKAPSNEELYEFLFKHIPMRQHIADCQVTLSSFLEGRKLKWW